MLLLLVQEMLREHKIFATCLSCSGLATTLMDATTDKDPLVQEQIYNALCYLGESEPEEILNSCDEYLRQHDKVGVCSAWSWECQQDEKYFLAARGYWLGQQAREIPGRIWATRVVDQLAEKSGPRRWSCAGEETAIIRCRG